MNTTEPNSAGQRNKTVAADLSVGRHHRIGGNLRLQGMAEIGHDLKVGGWLSARHIKGTDKGYFTSPVQLEDLYPEPMPGWWAIVEEEDHGQRQTWLYTATAESPSADEGAASCECGCEHPGNTMRARWERTRQIDFDCRITIDPEGLKTRLEQIANMEPIHGSGDTAVYDIIVDAVRACMNQTADYEKSLLALMSRVSAIEQILRECGVLTRGFVVRFADDGLGIPVYRYDNFKMELRGEAFLDGEEVTDRILPEDTQWTRYSEDSQGQPRTISDARWSEQHNGAGMSLNLDKNDLDCTAETVPRMAVFTLTAGLRDSEGRLAQRMRVSANTQYV